MLRIINIGDHPVTGVFDTGSFEPGEIAQLTLVGNEVVVEKKNE